MGTIAQRPPVRAVHLGLGAFHRAHQVWMTERGDPAWGYAAFSGRSARLAETLTAQDCRYTLIERGPDADVFHTMSSLVLAAGADRHEELCRLLADPAVAVVTMTVTEAGYLVGPDGTVDGADPSWPADVKALRDGGAPRTAPGRLLGALAARRRAGLGPIAVVPCDNILANGARIRTALLGLAHDVDRELERWLREQVSFVDTVADRITPAGTDEDAAAAARATGRLDRAPVVTEPFAEWILSGEFPAGRPGWEHAGARFVADIRPFERRKLRLLNGAHLLLALTGRRRGHHTVAAAIADPDLRLLTEEYWSVAAAGIPDAEAYLQQLRTRFANARIRHSLDQIAVDAEAKLRERVVPVVAELLANGADPTPALRVVAAWLTDAGLSPDGAQSDAALDRLAAGWAADRPLRRSLNRAALDLGRPAAAHHRPVAPPTHPNEGRTE